MPKSHFAIISSSRTAGLPRWPQREDDQTITLTLLTVFTLCPVGCVHCRTPVAALISAQNNIKEKSRYISNGSHLKYDGEGGLTRFACLDVKNHGEEGIAKAVGGQILYNNVPLKLNGRLVLKKSAGGEETFSLTARYFHTSGQVTPGSANTTAMLTLTYQ